MHDLPNVEPVPEVKRPEKTRPHLPFLDGIRALCALYVVVHHAAINNRAPSASYLSPFLLKGDYAVDIFIVLSGFSLMLPVAMFGNLKGGPKAFFYRRARRVLPPYYAAIALSVLLGLTVVSQQTGTTWDNSVPIRPLGLLAHLFLVQDVSIQVSHKISYPLWSISVESHIYLLFPLIVLAFSRYRGWAVAAGALLFGYTIQLLLTHTRINCDPNGTCPYYLGLFALGCLASRLVVNASDRVKWYPFAAIVATLVAMNVAGTLWMSTFNQMFPPQAASLFIGLMTAAALVGLGAGKWPAIRHALSWRPVAFIGTFAYSIYLIHAPVLQIVWQFLVRPTGLTGSKETWMLILVATPLITLVSWLFFLVCEKPFISRSPAAERLAAP